MSAVQLATVGYPLLLDALTADFSIKVHLYTNDPDLTIGRVAADFVEPIYDGYLPVGVKKYTPAVLLSGSAFSDADPAAFIYTTGTLPLPIRGFYVTESASGVFLWAWRKPGLPFTFSPSMNTLVVLQTFWLPILPAP